MSGKIFQGWQWKELFGDGISEGRYGKQNKNIRSTQVHCYVKYGRISEALFKYIKLLQQWYQQ